MGLDIIALQKVTWHPVVEDYDWESLHMAYPNPDFADRADGRAEGLYSAEGELRFRAGSYSGYNRWREWLSAFALGVRPRDVWNNYEAFTGRPFVELIHFSDCEGMIGPKTSAKLARDFGEHKPLGGDDGEGVYFLAKYREWTQAFEMAADDGLVQFA